MKNLILKITAWAFLILGILIGLSIIALIFILPFIISEAKLTKLVLADFIIFLIGCLVIVVGFGIYEFFLSLIKMEEEIEEIELDLERENK